MAMPQQWRQAHDDDMTCFESSKTLRKQLQYICSKLNVAAGIPIPTRVGLLGKMGVLGDPCIPVVLDEPATIWFTFGTDLGKHVEQVQVYDEKREKLHKMLVFVIVNLVKDALHVVNKWKVDVLVIQGTEASGHGGAAAPPLLNLLQGVLDTIPDVALFTLRASEVILRTLFLFMPKCMYSDQILAFDKINRTAMWPEGIDGRAIANDILLKKTDEDKAEGKTDHLVIWAGVGVRRIKDIKEETVAALIKCAQLQ
ncbi:hypothetical protein K443DRAFT_134440 [Laccaria amethystina LaAM-08-1]|uniref:Uncharacterized protein n=1 Tax=Laccaria amethystina LaAM-08-1 TaxID=1095629 RepID=A0A0C9XGU8_9AGAR|nr:hypothetical protein K443DRAFT_134440 [Laccaria amethystina LaAM-08-1]